MSKFAKVKLLAQGGVISLVEYQNITYQVYTNTLHNCITESTNAGFITYCHINPVYLKQRLN